MSRSVPNPAQIRMAMGALGWETSDLAEAAGITPDAVLKIKKGVVNPQPRTLSAIRFAFESNGLEFTDNSGVRFRTEGVEVLNGTEGLSALLDDVYTHLSERGGTVMVTGVVDEQWTKAGGDHIAKVHVPRMIKLCKERDDVEVLSLCPAGTFKFDYDGYTKYRAQPRETFDAVPFYVYGDNLAIIIFQADPPPKIILIRSNVVANAYRKQFQQLWAQATEIPSKRKNATIINEGTSS